MAVGVLVKVFAPRFDTPWGTRQRRITIAKMQVGNFKTALELFQVDNGRFPSGSNGLKDLVVKPEYVGKEWHPYMEAIPLDPWSRPYIYICPGLKNTNGYDLLSAGPDGAVGTADDIENSQSQK